MAGDRLRVVFMGTPGFAAPVLSGLLDAGHEVAGVYTRPDRRAGRERRLLAPEMKSFAAASGLPVFQPASLRRDEEARRRLAALRPELIVVAAYGLFLPQAVLDTPPLHCLNVHPSLLPRHRGPSPVAAAIMDGDEETGVTLMMLDQGMDTGPIVARRRTAIGADETGEALTACLFRMGAELLVDTLPAWARGEIEPLPQDEALATITSRLTREDGEIDWSLPAERTARQVRAYHPWPGSHTAWEGRSLKVIEAGAAGGGDGGGGGADAAGRVVSLGRGRMGVATGDGVLELRRVQLGGRSAVDAAGFLAGHPGIVGSVLGCSR